MIALSLTEAASALSGQLQGISTRFNGVSTDTRTLNRGELFVALKGPHHDGHDSLAEAVKRGAVGAIVSRESGAGIPYIRVTETRRALGALARAWRVRRDIPVIGVTGSNGKTSTKEMIAAILRERGDVLATQGNLNNDIGVPLTLFHLAHSHQAAVIEMGANGMHDIAELSEIALPTVGVVTMCGPAHLAGFGSIENIAQAKGQLYQHLSASGFAVINADDRFSDYWRGVSRAGTLVTFGIDQPADYRAHNIELGALGTGTKFELRSPAGNVVVTLPFDGRHNVYNALAAAAAAMAAGASLENVSNGLARAQRVKGRLDLKDGIAGCVVIDDTYNANPASLAAALAVLARCPAPRWLVLGDMAELGVDQLSQHREAGLLARREGIERLFTIGHLAHAATEAFGLGAEHYRDCATLLDALRHGAGSGVTVLVKGSRVMQLEKIVAGLTVPGANAC